MSGESVVWDASTKHITGGTDVPIGVAEKVQRETAACKVALSQAYSDYQKRYDSILRAYWGAMQEIVTPDVAADMTQEIQGIDWTQNTL